MLHSKKISRLIVVGSLAFSSSLFAGGFQLWEQDVSDLGDYHAGAAAEADAAGVEFYNPAGVTRLDKQEISFGAALVGLDVSYSGTVTSFGSTESVTNAQGGTTNWIPNFHYVRPLPHHLWFSFGETTPFGLETDYDANSSPVNSLATETKLETFNLNPSLAYEVNRHLSLGVGFDALYGSADYDNVFATSTISTDLGSWGYGYNAGALIQFTPETRLGLSYRSKITVDASGTSSATATLLPTAAVNSSATATLPLPATSILSLYHDFNSRFSMMATAFYTQWSCFDQLVIYNLATPLGVTNLPVAENYRNTWNLALGGKYRFNQFLSMEAGFGHDQTPTQVGYRDIRLPDNNRYAASVGLNIQPKPGFIWSMGWTHFFVPTTPIDNSKSDTTGLTPVSLGNETGNINVIGTQFSVVI
ncbi:MAG: outer membrane protein transport protein [Coxiellaceae bacterium]|nr:outer membrane protein transport protein [Coxiellaceae bacterium]